MFGPIGSSVLTFNGYKQTERQAKYITFQRIESLNIFFCMHTKIALLHIYTKKKPGTLNF